MIPCDAIFSQKDTHTHTERERYVSVCVCERGRVVSGFNQYHDYIINGLYISRRPCVTIFSRIYIYRERERYRGRE